MSLTTPLLHQPCRTSSTNVLVCQDVQTCHLGQSDKHNSIWNQVGQTPFVFHWCFCLRSTGTDQHSHTFVEALQRMFDLNSALYHVSVHCDCQSWKFGVRLPAHSESCRTWSISNGQENWCVLMFVPSCYRANLASRLYLLHGTNAPKSQTSTHVGEYAMQGRCICCQVVCVRL